MQRKIMFPINFIVVGSFILCLICSICSAAELNKESISFKTNDGITIKGYYIPPASNSKKVFILLPMLGNTKESYDEFAKKLTDLGYGVLAYDQRGHGESDTSVSGKKIDYNSFASNGKDNDWNKMIDDLGNAVDFLISQKKTSETHIGIVGASIGANIALNYAAKNNTITPIVLLSPGLSFHDVTTDNVVNNLKNKQKVLIVAAKNDMYSYTTAEKLQNIVKSNKSNSKDNAIKNVELLLNGTSGHGTSVLRSNGTMGNVLQWISDNS